MADDFEVIGKIVVDQSGAVSIQGINTSLGEMETKAGGVSNAFSNLGSIANFVWGSLIVKGVESAISAIGNFLSSTVQSAKESQDAIANVAVTIKSTGGAAGYTVDQLQAMATSLQGVTKFSDETILRGQGMLLTFTSIGHDVFPMATQAMLDLAQKMGTDVQGSAIQLGKALNDPVAGLNALHRVGVQFTDDQKEMIKQMVAAGDTAGAQGVILHELATEFGGVAQAAGTTFSGQMEIAKNKLDDFKELVGGPVLYVMGQLMGSFMSFSNNPAMTILTQFLTDFNKYLGEGIDPLLAAGWAVNNLGDGFKWLADAFFLAQQAFVSGESPLQVFQVLLAQLTAAPGILGQVATGFQTVFDTIVNASSAGNIGGFFSSLLDQIQGGLANVDWSALGNLLIQGIQNIDWIQVGQAIRTVLYLALRVLDFIAYAITQIIEKTDWGALSKVLGVALQGMVAGAFGYMNWQALSTDFWNGFASMFGYSSGAAFENMKADFQRGALAIGTPLVDWGNTFINWWNTLWSNFRIGWNYVKDYFVQMGGDIIDGIKAGFSGNWQGWWSAITDYFTTFIKHVKFLLGIASPSSIFADIGKNIMQGLIDGFNGMVNTTLGVITKIVKQLLEPFKPILDLLGIDLSGLTGGSVYTPGDTKGETSTGSGGASGSAGTVINQYFYNVVNVGAMSDLISFDCTVNPVVNSTYPSPGGLGGGAVGGLR